MPLHRWPSRILIANTARVCLDNIACNDRGANPSHMSCIVFHRMDYVSKNKSIKRDERINQRYFPFESSDTEARCVSALVYSRKHIAIDGLVFVRRQRVNSTLHAHQTDQIDAKQLCNLFSFIGNGFEWLPLLCVCVRFSFLPASLDFVLNECLYLYLYKKKNKTKKRNKIREKRAQHVVQYDGNG